MSSRASFEDMVPTVVSPMRAFRIQMFSITHSKHTSPTRAIPPPRALEGPEGLEVPLRLSGPGAGTPLRYREAVPRISAFYGIVIFMYWNEGDHSVVHFHAHHGELRASITLGGTLLAGELDPGSIRLVRKWANLHVGEIRENWERARRYEPLLPIDPLP